MRLLLMISLYHQIKGKNWPLTFLKKTIQHFALFPKLIREMPPFETRFSQNRVKPYSDVFKEPIVTF